MASNGADSIENRPANSDELNEALKILPKFMFRSNRELYGATMPTLPLKEKDPADQIKDVRTKLKVREDDIFVLAFPKCGTHWVWEITQMLVNQSTQYEKRTKEFAMLEFSAMEPLEKEPSPRILNSHLLLNHLPNEDIVSKKAKIIHIVRNPKDTLVSLYYHSKQALPEATEYNFNTLVTVYLAKAVMAHNQFEYLRHMREFEKSHPDHPVKHICYEEMKKDPVPVIKGLAEFLQVPASDTFCAEVAAACSFDKMKKLDESRDIPKEILDRLHVSGDSAPKWQLYRKGMIGDWKNHLTVAQNEVFDEFIRKESAGLGFSFIYE